MKLNWFSPLPPIKTDIANYTLRILCALQNYAEITLWTDQSSWNLEAKAQVRQYQLDHLSWAELNRANLNIYNIGNNPDFHSQIWQISIQCPGLIILHDCKLHHFFYNVYYRQNQREDYLTQMNRLYGDHGKKAAEKMWQGGLSIDYMAEKYPLTSLALENALGVVTHTKDSLQQEQDCPVCYIPLPYPHKFKAKTSSSLAPPYRLITFGFIDINRRLEVFLKALSSFEPKKQFHLDIYGQLWDKNYINQRIQELALDDLVTVQGFVEEAELDAALSNAHLAINLRYPTVGEASGSQLRIWSHALPSLVTQIGWYAQLQDTVAFVRPEYEIEDIHQHLQNFLANPKQYWEMGQKGRKLLEEQHSPESYAKDFIDFADKAQKFKSCSTAYKLVERVGECISPWTDRQVSEQEVKRIAQSIYFICSSE